MNGGGGGGRADRGRSGCVMLLDGAGTRGLVAPLSPLKGDIRAAAAQQHSKSDSCEGAWGVVFTTAAWDLPTGCVWGHCSWVGHTACLTDSHG